MFFLPIKNCSNINVLSAAFQQTDSKFIAKSPEFQDFKTWCGTRCCQFMDRIKFNCTFKKVELKLSYFKS